MIFGLVNKVICKFLNGDGIEYPSNPKYAEAREEHKHEQWVFLNGVAVGYVTSRLSLHRELASLTDLFAENTGSKATLIA